LSAFQGIAGFIAHFVVSAVFGVFDMIIGWVIDFFDLIASLFGADKIFAKFAQAFTGDERNEHML
jgi:uncharacterized membrane protein YuzA (DUF378 family)